MQELNNKIGFAPQALLTLLKLFRVSELLYILSHHQANHIKFKFPYQQYLSIYITVSK
jgi:hypothetical protein